MRKMALMYKLQYCRKAWQHVDLFPDDVRYEYYWHYKEIEKELERYLND